MVYSNILNYFVVKKLILLFLHCKFVSFSVKTKDKVSNTYV